MNYFYFPEEGEINTLFSIFCTPNPTSMNLQGSHTIKAKVDTIWGMLLNPDILARITPGISRLEKTGEDQYRAIAEIKMGPVDGTFTGDLEVAEKNPPESFILRIKQTSRIGNVKADVKMQLKPLNENETEVSFDGKANLSGLLARTGQRVIGGVANALSRQFFEALQKEVENNRKV